MVLVLTKQVGGCRLFSGLLYWLSQRVRRLNYVRNISVILLWSLLRTSGSISDISGLSDCCYVGWHRHGLLLPWLFHQLAGHITDRVCMPDILQSCFVSCPFRRSVRSIAFQSLPSKCYSCGRAGSCRYGMSRKRYCISDLINSPIIWQNPIHSLSALYRA